MSPDDFLGKYAEINRTKVEDSATFYDLSKLPRKLPPTKTVEEAIGVLEGDVPTLFQKGKFILYSPKFYEKIREHLVTFAAQTQNLSVRMPTYLNDYYVFESDFKQQPRTIVLVGEDNFNIWQASLERAGYSGIIIQEKLDLSFMTKVEPYLYKTEEGVTYLVQNVEDGDLARALNIAYFWQTELVNSGYKTMPYPNYEDLSYRVYEISPSLILHLKEVFLLPNVSSDESLEILYYTENIYAALLPISYEEV